MSAPEIEPNKLQADAEIYATDLLVDSAEWARALLGNMDGGPTHPIATLGHAMLTLLDRRAEERYIQHQAIIEGLQDIRESIDFLAARPETEAASDTPEPASKKAFADYEWLKGLLEVAHPELSDAKYRKAITRIQRIVGV